MPVTLAADVFVIAQHTQGFKLKVFTWYSTSKAVSMSTYCLLQSVSDSGAEHRASETALVFAKILSSAHVAVNSHALFLQNKGVSSSMTAIRLPVILINSIAKGVSSWKQKPLLFCSL